MGGIVNDGDFRFDDLLLEVLLDGLLGQLFPQAGLGHDLVEVLDFAEAGDVGVSFWFTRARDGEAAGAGEGGIFAEFLVDELRFGWLAADGCAEERFGEGEEALGRSAGEAEGSDAGPQAGGVDAEGGRLRGWC